MPNPCFCFLKSQLSALGVAKINDGMFSVKVMSNQCVVFKKGSFLPLAWEGDLI
jgi:hypothetical protein